ncbi:MAG: PAS domain S-box protein [Candidatus Bathyarchaeum sp.]|nr:MAG: PAS domain S-box protein [Candidatus Bathyarchaeum sp.]
MPGVTMILEDITERKKMEEELILLSNAVKMSTDSIVITDIDTKILDVNEATLRMYGVDDKSDLIGKNSFDLIAPEDRENASVVLSDLMEKGSRKIQEFKVITRDGTKKVIEMSLGVIKDADGKPIGLVAISRDVHEHKKTK